MNYVKSFDSFLFEANAEAIRVDFLNEGVLNEIGDSSAKPFTWSSSSSVEKWLENNIELTKDKKYSGSSSEVYHLAYKDSAFTYSFTSDITNTNYVIRIGGWFYKNFYIPVPHIEEPPKYGAKLAIGFSVKDAKSDDETNLNEHFRVLATVVECALDFLNKMLSTKLSISISEFCIYPKTDKDNQIGADSKRGKMYLAYIKNSFRKLNTDKHYYIEQDQYGWILKFDEVRGPDKSIPASVVFATFT